MDRSGGSRRPAGWMPAACVVSMLLAVGCAGGATPSAAPAASDRPTNTPDAAAAAVSPPVPVVSSPAPVGTDPPMATASPAASASADAALPIRRVDDVAYVRTLGPASSTGVEPGTEVRLDVFAPVSGGPWPIVVRAPGGEEKRSMGWSFGEMKAARGAVVFVIDTVHGMNPAAEPLGVGSRMLVEDAACAVRTARALAPSYGGDPERVVWSGHSLGGVFGFELALADPESERLWTDQVAANGGPGPTVECLTAGGSSRIDAVVIAGSGRLIEIWPTTCDADPAVRAFTESVSHVGNNPSLVVRLVHGDPDPDLPLSFAQSLQGELSAAGYDATLTTVDLGGHGLFFPQLVEQILGVVRSPGW